MKTADVTRPAAGGWWRDGDALARFIADLVEAESKRLRPGQTLSRSAAARSAWRPDLRLDENGMGFDSLERLQLAAALSDALHMQESGIADYLLVHPTLGDWHEIAQASLDRHSDQVTMCTSGSTGVPKPCPHRLADLSVEVGTLADILRDRRRVLTTVSCHHIYGFLFTILLPARLGLPVLDLRDHSPGSLASLLRPGDVVIGHPAFWTAAARAVPGWPDAITGVTSTAPCPAETVRDLRSAGLSRLVEVHGSSETAGIGWRDDPDVPYTLMPHWVRARDGRLRRRKPAGTAVLDPPDQIMWIDARHYRLRGRRDGAVQVGGINVFPNRVVELLRRQPGVADVAVRLMAPGEGQRLKAFVVPQEGITDLAGLRDSLEALAARELTGAERPRAYDFGHALPTGAMGKATDWPIGVGILQAGRPG